MESTRISGVWDDKLATLGTTLTERREALVIELVPLVTEAYASTDSDDPSGFTAAAVGSAPWVSVVTA